MVGGDHVDQEIGLQEYHSHGEEAQAVAAEVSDPIEEEVK